MPIRCRVCVTFLRICLMASIFVSSDHCRSLERSIQCNNCRKMTRGLGE